MIERSDFTALVRARRIAAMRKSCWSPLPRQRPTGNLRPPDRMPADVRYRAQLAVEAEALKAALAEPKVRERRIDADHVVLERTDQQRGR